MAHFDVVIETRSEGGDNGPYVAEVVQGGPKWVRDWAARSPSAHGAFTELANRIRCERVRSSFEFIHAMRED